MTFHRTFFVISFLAVLVILAHSCSRAGKTPGTGLAWYKKESHDFVIMAIALKESFANLSGTNHQAVNEAREAFRRCRLQYKHIAFFLEYFFPEEAIICNGPPIQEVESQEEFREPTGLQMIGSLLYSKNPSLHKQELIIQADLLARTVENFTPLLRDFKCGDQELLESLGLELVRLITLYITGFDGPEAKTGIEEAYASLSTISALLTPYTKNYPQKDSLAYCLASGKAYLQSHPDFDSFNRLFFITSYALPIEKHINQLIHNTGGTILKGSVLNGSARDLFAADAINKKSFPAAETNNDTLLADLGNQLFFEKALSGNNTRSCATCHSPGSYFTDQLSRNRSMDGTAELPRNTPSLLYVCYQYAQFWDGHAESLADQVREVLKSKTEMNVSSDTVIKRLSDNPIYAGMFKKIWPGDSSVSIAHTAGAIAAFIRTLTPFRSAFDHYLQGDHTALSASQQRGFNIFMGKAQCGTCHFAPIFNGLLPPEYTTTEFEILGTTTDDHFDHPYEDNDQGRYTFKPFPLNKGAFKTPSIRNAAKTAPYMHNGRFSTLENVIEFYDKGGGAGLGLHIPQQTLSSTPLQLSKQEKSDIVSFIEALTDK